MNRSKVPPTEKKSPERSLPPNTTSEEDVNTASQRKVNLIWEYTQAFIAILVITANMVAALFNVVKGRDVAVPLIMSSSLFLVVGFYFSRTNHSQIGGLGKKPNPPYEGR